MCQNKFNGYQVQTTCMAMLNPILFFTSAWIAGPKLHCIYISFSINGAFTT